MDSFLSKKPDSKAYAAVPDSSKKVLHHELSGTVEPQVQ